MGPIPVENCKLPRTRLLQPRRALLDHGDGSEGGSNNTSSKGMSPLVWVYIGAGGAVILLLLFVVCCLGYWLTKRRANTGRRMPFNDLTPSEVLGGKTEARIMSYETLAEATNQFDPDRRIGLGRFGPIYMGELPDGTEVAVRRLSLNSRQGKREFAKGVKNIIELQHRNVVKLIGCCYSNSRLLVYEYIGNGSVASALFEGKINLEWSTRYKILLETAQGLSYLHEESQRILAHGDIKASNILLDITMRPKIADFGLANLFYYDAGEVKFQDMASVGYMAPELALHGQLSGKADVFSFGVLALEVVSGRTNTDINLIGTNMQHLLAWVWKLQEREQVIKILDPRIKGNYMEEEVKKVINIAILCTQDAPKLRPTMARVVSMLKGESPLPNMPSKPGAMQALGLGEQNMSGTFSIRIPSERKSRRWGLSSSTASGITHSGRMQYSVVIPR
ncbi:unnamed protein product [Sphagnum jensenii]|uniref:Protein kinase domain-containing protein n=1 Tax=Sphagnum jensenii TaxID=128206 RepID=A0ABP1A8B3_9BRYO